MLGNQNVDMDKRETTHTWLVLDADPRHMEQSTDDCTSRV